MEKFYLQHLSRCRELPGKRCVDFSSQSGRKNGGEEERSAVYNKDNQNI